MLVAAAGGAHVGKLLRLVRSGSRLLVPQFLLLAEIQRQALFLGILLVADDISSAILVVDGVEVLVAQDEVVPVGDDIVAGEEHLQLRVLGGEAHGVARLAVDVGHEEHLLVGTFAANGLTHALQHAEISPVREIAFLAYLQTIVDKVVVFLG